MREQAVMLFQPGGETGGRVSFSQGLSFSLCEMGRSDCICIIDTLAEGPGSGSSVETSQGGMGVGMGALGVMGGVAWRGLSQRALSGLGAREHPSGQRPVTHGPQEGSNPHQQGAHEHPRRRARSLPVSI